MYPSDISPETKIAALLEAHPEVEEVLFRSVPPFAVLKSGGLWPSVAKVATVAQAARVRHCPWKR